jgi:hypothetical protein
MEAKQPKQVQEQVQEQKQANVGVVGIEASARFKIDPHRGVLDAVIEHQPDGSRILHVRLLVAELPQNVMERIHDALGEHLGPYTSVVEDILECSITQVSIAKVMAEACQL